MKTNNVFYALVVALVGCCSSLNKTKDVSVELVSIFSVYDTLNWLDAESYYEIHLLKIENPNQDTVYFDVTRDIELRIVSLTDDIAVSCNPEVNAFTTSWAHILPDSVIYIPMLAQFPSTFSQTKTAKECVAARRSFLLSSRLDCFVKTYLNGRESSEIKSITMDSSLITVCKKDSACIPEPIRRQIRRLYLGE